MLGILISSRDGPVKIARMQNCSTNKVSPSFLTRARLDCQYCALFPQVYNGLYVSFFSEAYSKWYSTFQSVDMHYVLVL